MDWSEQQRRTEVEHLRQQIQRQQRIVTGKVLVDDTGGGTGHNPQVIGSATVDTRCPISITKVANNFDFNMAQRTARRARPPHINQVDGVQTKPSLTVLDNGFIAVTWETSAGQRQRRRRRQDIFPTGIAITGEFTIAAGSYDEDGGGLAGGVLAHVYKTMDSTSTAVEAE